MRKSVSLFVMAAVLLSMMMVNTAIAFSCLHALHHVIPCQDYLVGGASKPSTECCKGVKDLANIANESKSERRSLCRCLKSAAQHLSINERKAKAMPKFCHANLNVSLSPHVDCNKV